MGLMYQIRSFMFFNLPKKTDMSFIAEEIIWNGNYSAFVSFTHLN